jgi:hypothetical protein
MSMPRWLWVFFMINGVFWALRMLPNHMSTLELIALDAHFALAAYGFTKWQEMDP